MKDTDGKLRSNKTAGGSFEVPQLLLEGKPLSSPLIASLNSVVVPSVSLLQPFGVGIQQIASRRCGR